MDALAIALTVVVACATTAIVTFILVRRASTHSRQPSATTPEDADQPVSSEQPEIPVGIADVLDALRASSLVVDVDDAVLRASPGAHLLGLVS